MSNRTKDIAGKERFQLDFDFLLHDTVKINVPPLLHNLPKESQIQAGLRILSDTITSPLFKFNAKSIARDAWTLIGILENDHNLPKIDLINRCAARMRTFENKYEMFNWAGGNPNIKFFTVYEAILRHLNCLLKNEYIDPDHPEDKYGHVTAIICNAMILTNLAEGGDQGKVKDMNPINNPPNADIGEEHF